MDTHRKWTQGPFSMGVHVLQDISIEHSIIESFDSARYILIHVTDVTCPLWRMTPVACVASWKHPKNSYEGLCFVYPGVIQVYVLLYRCV